MTILQHLLKADPMLAGVCLAAAYTATVKLQNSRLANGSLDMFKLQFASVALGFGAWAAQFIGLLDTHALAVARFAPWTVLASLAASLLSAAAGLSLLIAARQPAGRLTAGAIMGLGIVLTHGLSLAAVRGLDVTVRPNLAVAGAVLTIALSALAGAFRLNRSLLGQAARAGLVTLAVMAAHLCSLQAVAFAPQVATASAAVSVTLLSQMVALTSALVLLMCLWAFSRETRRRVLEAEALHLRELADAVLEGLLIVDHDQIVASNRAMSLLAGRGIAQGSSAKALFGAADLDQALAQPGVTVEACLTTQPQAIPVELVVSAVHYRGADRHAIAVRDLRSRRQAEDQIRILARTDALTGLLNRASCIQKLDLDLARMRRAQDKIAVLYLDLDRFKQVNDLHGHAAGDAVLRETALRIQPLLGPEDSFARLGGDEFAIIRTSAVTPEGLDALCNAILATITPPFPIGSGRTALVGSSLGVAVFPHDGTTAESLLAAADAALYQAKAAGRGAYRFFEAALAETLKARQQLEHDLRQALDLGQLRMVYQPQARVADRHVDGYEALIRWDHPRLGAVSPDRFIPIAEESGLILSVGEWVLRQACREAAGWPGREVVSVNLSAVQLHAASLPATVHAILVETGLSPRRLELEITETALIKNGTQALHILRQLKALGVSIAMDDFGTGFSSLSNLRNYPIDTIKIDGSFVRGVDHDPQSATIVRAVLGLGGGLGMKVIAEGVETREEERFLIDEGCRHAQGFYYGAPTNLAPPTWNAAHG